GAREPIEFETHFEPAGRWFEIKVSPAPAGGLGVFLRDITDRKSVQLALAASEERLRLAQEGARAGIWDRDVVSERPAWSGGYYEIHGLDRAELASHERFLELVHPEDRPMVERHLADAMAATHRVEVIYRILHPSLGIRWIVARGSVLVDAANRPLRTT